jgi:hypothetical protein
MRRYQEGRQRQGLRTIFKPLKERYGKADESQWMILRRSPLAPVKEVLRGRRFSSDEEVTGMVQNWLKTQQKKLFSDGSKKNCETLESVR